MSLPEVILDTSWTVQYFQGASQSRGLSQRFPALHQADADSELTDLSRECFEYVRSRIDSELTDDLNDERDRTGQLRDCRISRVIAAAGVQNLSRDETLGMLVESRYQKTTCQIILLTCPPKARNADHSIVAILYKASQSNLQKIKGWLKEKFDLPHARPAEFEAETLARVCSRYFTILSGQGLLADSDTEALRTAVLQQVVGHLRISISFSHLVDPKITPDLKTIDLDLPSDTVGSVLLKIKENTKDTSKEGLFLDELADMIFQKTGLRLPLKGRRLDTPTHHEVASANHTAEDGSEEALGPMPLQLSRISCAAFAISSEGKFKLASKPIESASAVGYAADAVVEAHWSLLRLVREAAQEVSSGNAD